MRAALVAMLTSRAGAASADPDKDESGNGRERRGYERSYEYPNRGYGDDFVRPRRELRA
jgi:hypothetical protein